MTDSEIDELVEAGFLLGSFAAINVTLPDAVSDEPGAGDAAALDAATIGYIRRIADGTDTPLHGAADLAATMREEGATAEQMAAEEADRRKLQHAIQRAAVRLLRQMVSKGQAGAAG